MSGWQHLGHRAADEQDTGVRHGHPDEVADRQLESPAGRGGSSAAAGCRASRRSEPPARAPGQGADGEGFGWRGTPRSERHGPSATSQPPATRTTLREPPRSPSGARSRRVEPAPSRPPPMGLILGLLRLCVRGATGAVTSIPLRAPTDAAALPHREASRARPRARWALTVPSAQPSTPATSATGQPYTIYKAMHWARRRCRRRSTAAPNSASSGSSPATSQARGRSRPTARASTTLRRRRGGHVRAHPGGPTRPASRTASPRPTWRSATSIASCACPRRWRAIRSGHGPAAPPGVLTGLEKRSNGSEQRTSSSSPSANDRA